MAVLIPNMKLPESCWECPCFRHDTTMKDGFVAYPFAYQCNVTLRSTVDTGEYDAGDLVETQVYRFCPLKEVRYWKEEK